MILSSCASSKDAISAASQGANVSCETPLLGLELQEVIASCERIEQLYGLNSCESRPRSHSVGGPKTNSVPVPRDGPDEEETPILLMCRICE
jgi:hypothetical protein